MGIAFVASIWGLRCDEQPRGGISASGACMLGRRTRHAERADARRAVAVSGRLAADGGRLGRSTSGGNRTRRAHGPAATTGPA
jgi:hypothetical protein